MTDQDCETTVLDSRGAKHVPADRSQVEPKQLEITNLKETQGLLISNGALKNIELENDRLGQANISLLSRPSGMRIAECILFSNKLTEAMLGELKHSDSKIANGSTIEDMKLVESMNFSNRSADLDSKMEAPGLAGAWPTDARRPDEIAGPPPGALSGGCCSFLRSREELGFLLMPDFLILSVSFLFLAYGCSAPVVYLVPYALSVGVEHQHAAFLMSIFGISGIVGNIAFGWITDRK